MTISSDKEIYNSRILNAPLELVYEAFANPDHLKRWWGPNGFTNTFHEFNLKPGGAWNLTMHGPEKGNYENSSIFNRVEPLAIVTWTRTSQPLFDMEVAFKKVNEGRTEISFRMIFKTAEECDKVKKFAVSKNEENFDRLEKEIGEMIGGGGRVSE